MDEHILQIDADYDDINYNNPSNDESDGKLYDRISSDEYEDDFVESQTKSKLLNSQSNNLILKVIKKGKSSVINYCEELLRFFIKERKLSIFGIYFNSTSSALVEVRVDNFLKNYLLTIYEDRLGRKILKKKSIENIVKICDGKFPLIIKGNLLHIIVLPGVEISQLPCKNTHPIFGLKNGNIYNLLVGKFELEDDISIFDFFVVYNKKFETASNKIVGLRMQPYSDDEAVTCIRIILYEQELTNKLLVDLNRDFGVVRLTSETVHAFSLREASEICEKFTSLSPTEGIKFINAHDLILVELKGFKKVKRENKSEQMRFEGDKEKIIKKSIFERLGDKIIEN